jgi:hypothetical protein
MRTRKRFHNPALAIARAVVANYAMKNKSENLISQINESVFYKEFTFDKNEFELTKGESKELADNILLLDEIKIIIQIKERNKDLATKSADKWFSNKILNKAKNQIKETVSFLKSNNKIPVFNRREQFVRIGKISNSELKKIIIYDIEEQLSEKYDNLKFYFSSQVGNIHIFNVEDYYWVCKYLITPAELNEYLIFRERFFLLYENLINEFPEQYLLSHFIETNTDFTIKKEYSKTLSKLKENPSEFDVWNLINNISEKALENSADLKSTNYHKIIKEICKLKRYELTEFKSRFEKCNNHIKSKERKFPLRFFSPRTDCGFVFLPLTREYSQNWGNMLAQLMELYMYRHKLTKCIGTVFFYQNRKKMIHFGYLNYEWEYNADFEKLVEKEIKLLGNSEKKILKRYNLKNE